MYKGRKNRRDECKCGKVIVWDTEESLVKCKHCGTEYNVECDSVLVYWLEEIVERKNPYTTNAR